MNIFILLLFSLVMSESIIITNSKSPDGQSITFQVIEFGKCYYTGASTSEYYIQSGNNVTVSQYNTSSECTGTKNETSVAVSEENFKDFCLSRGCTVELKEIPDYIGYFGLDEDDNKCSHQNNAYMTYVTGICGKCDEVSNEYCRYKIENGSMYGVIYTNSQCDEQVKNKTKELWKCGSCRNSTIYKCESKPNKNSSDYIDGASLTILSLIGMMIMLFI
ncbi:hypothetical protein KM1_260520 [Entamoeba histolytica HM-3:IMSS]|nr:hypothetical protein KM1_260520 [Entamoeba histolytica HM-3:IMSS]GAT97974.1 hypothetical protein CL6EHI_077530 [Entamoeba histolytica]